MLQVCGTGIAMGNAPDELKALADDVTTSVSADGVANAFRRHGLI
jgi:hydroxymethylpyrimidine pyrophosphatase-like HAD family hydrolase